MTEPRIGYRHEYVSGIFELMYQGTEVEGSAIVSTLFNRGGEEQHGRFFYVGVETIGNLRTQVLYDSGDVMIGALSVGDLYKGIWAPENQAETGAVYWARILVTSLDLVPTASVTNIAAFENFDELTRFDNYFAPGDFAVYDVHEPLGWLPPVTVGPAE